MSFVPSRLRAGEAIAATAAVALLVFMFALPWYGLYGRFERLAQIHGFAVSVDAWHGLTINRWLLLVTIAVTLALAISQGSVRGPALPASLSVIATVLGIVSSLVLIDRVLIDQPFPDAFVEPKIGAYLGLVATLVLTYGAGRSLRQETPPDADRSASIPVVQLPPRP